VLLSINVEVFRPLIEQQIDPAFWLLPETVKRLAETETFNQEILFAELGKQSYATAQHFLLTFFIFYAIQRHNVAIGVNKPFVLDGIYVLKKIFIENMRKRVSCKRVYNYLDILKEAIIRDESAVVTMPTLVVKSMLLAKKDNVFFFNKERTVTHLLMEREKNIEKVAEKNGLVPPDLAVKGKLRLAASPHIFLTFFYILCDATA
jgi:hypothetical protein